MPLKKIRERLQRLRVVQSIRFRITGLFVAIFGSVLIAFSALLFSAFVRNHQAEFDADLYNHAVDISRAINVDVFGNISVDSELLSNGGKIFPFSAGHAFLQIVSMEGHIIARSTSLGQARLPFDTEDLAAVTQEGLFFRTINRKALAANAKTHDFRAPRPPEASERSYRLVTYLVRDRGPQPFILQVAVSLAVLDQEQRGLLLFFLVAIPFTLVLAAFGGWYLSASALAPVAAIIDKAKSLKAANLSERLPVPAVDDELKRLSLTLNELLDRLEQSFASQERFIADASHELKTPLAILRGELDVLKGHVNDPAEVTRFVASSSQELRHLSRMVEDLLLLARVDAGAGSLSIQKTRLDEILLDVVSRLEAVARARQVRIRLDFFSESFDIQGDPNLLQSLFQNLIENAVKFSPPGQTVEVTARETEGELAVEVHDYGPGIPQELLPRIFERFYRVKPRDTSVQTPGFGLGLAIARRVADAHGARLSVASSTEPGATGTSFTVGIKKF